MQKISKVRQEEREGRARGVDCGTAGGQSIKQAAHQLMSPELGKGGGAIKQASSQSIKGLGAAGWELGKGVVL